MAGCSDAGKPKLGGGGGGGAGTGRNKGQTTPISAGAALGRARRGRGAAGKTPFVAAVETTAERKPRRLRLTVVKGFRKKEVEGRWPSATSPPAATSSPMGLSCWTGGGHRSPADDHFPMLTGSRAARTPKSGPLSEWV